MTDAQTELQEQITHERRQPVGDIIFDIETGPLPLEELQRTLPPYEPPPPPGEFDPMSVKTGNLGPEKAREKIEACREKHAIEVATYKGVVRAGEEAYWADVVANAAKKPETGEVVAIGYLHHNLKGEDEFAVYLDIDREPDLLCRFWNRYEEIRLAHGHLIGHNIFGFDVPFLAKRSWICDVPVPLALFDRSYIEQHTFRDTMLRWSMGTKGTTGYVKLDLLARLLNVGHKPDGIDGGMFAGLLKTDPETAKEYLRNDLMMTLGVAGKLEMV